MPVTPFHFGPGVLVKALAPKAVSFVAFAAANIAIDVESLVNLLTGRYPVHATLHTFGASLIVGIVAGGAIALVGRASRFQSIEWAARPALIGGVLGGVSHPFLDGIMHGDIQPFLPITPENPLYRMVGLDVLHGVCVAAGFLGGAVVLWRAWQRAA